jgi:hypothetical protein
VSYGCPKPVECQDVKNVSDASRSLVVVDLDRASNERTARAQTGFFANSRKMSSYSTHAESQSAGDFFVREAFPDEPHDLSFSWGEMGDHPCRRGVSVGSFLPRGGEWEGRPFNNHALRGAFEMDG